MRNPWEQLCAVPGGDFAERRRFQQIPIDTFTETGIKLDSGQHIEA